MYKLKLCNTAFKRIYCKPLVSDLWFAQAHLYMTLSSPKIFKAHLNKKNTNHYSMTFTQKRCFMRCMRWPPHLPGLKFWGYARKAVSSRKPLGIANSHENLHNLDLSRLRTLSSVHPYFTAIEATLNALTTRQRGTFNQAHSLQSSNYSTKSTDSDDQLLDEYKDQPIQTKTDGIVPGKGPPPELPVCCCMSGCDKCVWLAYADELVDYYSEATPHVFEAIEKHVDDPNLKAYLLFELKAKGIKKKE